MLKITQIEKGSPAYKAGITSLFYIIEINGHEINDRLDFDYYSVDEPLKISFKDGITSKEIIFQESGNNGISVEEIKIKHCGNDCIFCFVTQNPKGLRKSLYVKDEDYRFSFLDGNYFTLTKTTQKELQRIVDMKLSPLYVSVHAIKPDVRKKLLGIKKDDDLMGKMKFLTDHNIEIHTQIVLCPDINDCKVLEDTITTLQKLYPQVASLAVVPVGKTKHRENLPKIRSITKDDAKNVISLISKYQDSYFQEMGARFVFPADEFFLKAEIDIPADEYYEDYQQYEDGIGMVRSFIDSFKEAAENFPKKIKKKTKITIVTGYSFYPVIEKYVIPSLTKIKGLQVELFKVENKLLGKEITVAGLLCGNDIINTVLENNSKSDILLIPDTCLNYNGLFLDDLSVDDLKIKLKRDVIKLDSFSDLFNGM
ncbi:MAG: DUF512 domain-containing protein [Candidatus Delongbacteria bacterium]|jgi:putative radical SAM enzyme (TIGR03279 family)|nr:DUF512 domain-containing protein [Candidatus Delongbacteria bacterium]